jgi:hypothetical protein
VMAVAQPYAEGDQMAGAAAALVHTLLSQWSWCHPSHPRRRWGMIEFWWRYGPLLEATK